MVEYREFIEDNPKCAYHTFYEHRERFVAYKDYRLVEISLIVKEQYKVHRRLMLTDTGIRKLKQLISNN